jgi:hypothetical protein
VFPARRHFYSPAFPCIALEHDVAKYNIAKYHKDYLSTSIIMNFGKTPLLYLAITATLISRHKRELQT